MVTTKSVKASDIMRRDVLSLAPDDTIEDALALFEEARISGAPVSIAMIWIVSCSRRMIWW